MVLWWLQYGEVDVALNDVDAAALQYSRRLCSVLLQQSIDVIRQWAAAVPGFTDLCPHDQQLLFRSALLEVITLRLADRSVNRNTSAMLYCCYSFRFLCRSSKCRIAVLSCPSVRLSVCSADVSWPCNE